MKRRARGQPRIEPSLQRTCVVQLRVTPEQLAAWQRAAELDQRSLSGWARARLDGLVSTTPPTYRKGGAS